MCLDTPDKAYGRRYILWVYMASPSDIRSLVQMFPFIFVRHPFCNQETPSVILRPWPKPLVGVYLLGGPFPAISDGLLAWLKKIVSGQADSS
jgi:hypothetical protein